MCSVMLLVANLTLFGFNLSKISFLSYMILLFYSIFYFMSIFLLISYRFYSAILVMLLFIYVKRPINSFNWSCKDFTYFFNSSFSFLVIIVDICGLIYELLPLLWFITCCNFLISIFKSSIYNFLFLF